MHEETHSNAFSPVEECEHLPASLAGERDPCALPVDVLEEGRGNHEAILAPGAAQHLHVTGTEMIRVGVTSA